MNEPFPTERFKDAIIGKKCWATVAGEGVGSVFHLYLGSKLKLDKPIPNNLLRDEIRWNDPEFSIMVWCAWRLEGEAEVITDWLDDNSNDGPLVCGLRKLEGETVVDLQVDPPDHRLKLRFTGNKVLHVLCGPEKDFRLTDQWFTSGPEGFFLAVRPDGSWTDRDK